MNYQVTGIQNVMRLDRPDASFTVDYQLPQAPPVGWKSIRCGKLASAPKSTPWLIPDGATGEILKFTFSTPEAEETVFLQQTGTGDQTMVHASLDGSQWTTIGEQQDGNEGVMFLGIPLSNGSEGILVIGTVDIGDQ